MSDDQVIEGYAKSMGGKLQDAATDFAGNAANNMRSKVNQATDTMQKAADSVQKSAGAAAGEMRGMGDQLAVAVKDQPLAFLALAGGIGLIMGFLLRR
jgi:ElaB/YqjD/DUF883 family membrane-anchored ribosome-binding protein